MENFAFGLKLPTTKTVDELVVELRRNLYTVYDESLLFIRGDSSLENERLTSFFEKVKKSASDFLEADGYNPPKDIDFVNGELVGLIGQIYLTYRRLLEISASFPQLSDNFQKTFEDFWDGLKNLNTRKSRDFYISRSEALEKWKLSSNAY